MFSVKETKKIMFYWRMFIWPACVWLALGMVWSSAAAGDPIAVMVSIPPQKEIVERIGGADVRVSVMLPPGKSPETYSPAPSKIRELGGAQVYFSIGVPFEEQFLPMVGESLPNLRVADMSSGIVRRALEEAHHHGEADGEKEHEHGRGEPDPHVWMAPMLLAQQADQVAVSLGALRPDRAADYQRAAVEYRRGMEALDAHLREMLLPFAGRTVFVYHPAFGYFTDAYGLKQEAIEQGGSSPTPRQLAQLITAARADEVRVIFVQPEFDQAKAATVAEAIRGRVVSLNPLDEHIAETLFAMGEAIRDALR